MRFIFENNNIIVYINNDKIDFSLIVKEEIEQFVKELILRLKKKHHKKISGFYKVKVYQNDSYGLILEMEKQPDLDLFPDLIDLKLIIYYDVTIYYETEDYFQIEKCEEIYELNNKYYINILNISKNELFKFIEFGKIIYGETLKNKMKNMKKIK